MTRKLGTYKRTDLAGGHVDKTAIMALEGNGHCGGRAVPVLATIRSASPARGDSRS